MPYKDKRKAYAASRDWDKRHPEKRAEYRQRYRKESPCSHCGAPTLDRRFRCTSCGMAPRGPKKLRPSGAYAPMGECRICGATTKLNWDHDHQTGAFRGYLCRMCNLGLGCFRDSADLLVKAARYVA